MFQELQFEHLHAKNRIFRSATGEYMASRDGKVTDGLKACYRELAKNEVGTIVTSHLCVANGGKAYPGQLMIHDDSFIDGLRDLCDVVHAYDTRILAQLNHVGEKMNPASNPDAAIVAPSSPSQDNFASKEQISAVKESFIQAALRAKQAGFDGVQIHLAHGYLLNQFMDPVINRRTDEYGGSVENRFRLTREILNGVRQACGEEYPVLVKINCNSKDNEQYDFAALAKLLQNCGVEAIEISGYDFLSFGREYEQPFYLMQAIHLKRSCNTPVILTGGFRDAKAMRHALDMNIDAIGLSRALIREPDFVKKIRDDPEHSSPCIRCNQCIKVYRSRFRHCVFDQVEVSELRDLFGDTDIEFGTTSHLTE